MVFSPLVFPGRPSDSCHLKCAFCPVCREIKTSRNKVTNHLIHQEQLDSYFWTVPFRLIPYWLLSVDNIQIYADLPGSQITFPSTCTLRKLSHSGFFFPISSELMLLPPHSYSTFYHQSPIPGLLWILVCAPIPSTSNFPWPSHPTEFWNKPPSTLCDFGKS